MTRDDAPLDPRLELLPPVLSFRWPLAMKSGSGSRVATDDREYLDFATGIACLNLGHTHPDLVDAVMSQCGRMWHAGWGTYPHEPLLAAAEAVTGVAPASIEQVLFLNSGAEAVEASIKLAKRATGRPGVIAFRGGFHGRTMGSVSYSTSKAAYRRGYHPLLASVYVAPFPQPFAWQMSQQSADELALAELARMLHLEIAPDEVAAILIEPVQGEGGYYPATSNFLGEVRRLCSEHGILLVVDEVQTGFGRTGSWFASDQLGVEPDVLVMGKAIANGLPLSAIGASRETFASWTPGSHGTTYGGNPLATAAASANIAALRSVVPGVNTLSEVAFGRLRSIQQRSHHVGDVRGSGLMIGVELVDGDGAPSQGSYEAVCRSSLERGLLVLPCGPDGNVVRFIPPLNIELDDLHLGLDILEQSIDDLR